MATSRSCFPVSESNIHDIIIVLRFNTFLYHPYIPSYKSFTLIECHVYTCTCTCTLYNHALCACACVCLCAYTFIIWVCDCALNTSSLCIVSHTHPLLPLHLLINCCLHLLSLQNGLTALEVARASTDKNEGTKVSAPLSCIYIVL